MCKIYDFMTEMEKRYKDKNILWDTTKILEGTDHMLTCLDEYKINKDAGILGDILGIFMSISFTLNHLIDNQNDNKLAYENKLKSIVNLSESFEEHSFKFHQASNPDYHIDIAVDLLKEVESLTKEIWNAEADKIKLVELKKELTKEEMNNLAKKIISFNSSTDHKRLVPYFLELCA